jgi:predicted metal-dependent peptidase
MTAIAVTKPQPIDNSKIDLDIDLLVRELDKTKSKIWIGKNAAFLAPLMCSMPWIWSTDCWTAKTDYTHLFCNPFFFLANPPKVREFVIVHELWHPAKLHNIRMGDRHPLLWNYACDININNDLVKNGYSFQGLVMADGSPVKPWYDPSFGDATPEDIYAKLFNDHRLDDPDVPWNQGEDDLLPPDESTNEKVVNNVIRAKEQARINGSWGDVPGEIEQILDRFLNPVVPWRQVLYQWFTELTKTHMTWKRPNRRYKPRDIHLPSRYRDRGKLANLVFFWDTSGSISNEDIIRFSSEVKFIKDVFKPEKLTIVQFDTMIQKILEFDDTDAFVRIEIAGRGGTHLGCVREYIMKHEPTAAIIFSDLFCEPMQEGPECPIIWATVGNPSATVPFGKLIHIED